MRYTEEKYQAFLKELMQRILWKSSISVLRPDFGQKKAPLRV